MYGAFVITGERSDALAPVISRLSTVTRLYMMGILYGHISKDRFAGNNGAVPSNFGRYSYLVATCVLQLVISDGRRGRGYFVLFENV